MPKPTKIHELIAAIADRQQAATANIQDNRLFGNKRDFFINKFFVFVFHRRKLFKKNILFIVFLEPCRQMPNQKQKETGMSSPKKNADRVLQFALLQIVSIKFLLILDAKNDLYESDHQARYDVFSRIKAGNDF